ncbi:hypothetical protein [Brevibacillus nitrificans]|uniref:hypothetical protein n=1 Tax=Brevibacillus nitrificans TaxID=651560 RepID=UPI00260DDF5A|nr:hypothetical protein [Brevibacillus nitrificans]
MEYICFTCQQVFETGMQPCQHLAAFFASLQGQKIWRLRFLNRYAYEFYSDPQIQQLLAEYPLMVSEVLCVDEFDCKTHTGVNALGTRVSIFA